ncbi:hypothetical protein TruAng_008448 [Truncatella angustata]|nr:hypothetical protein TruAng_008448 [Truncatella angustata]
MLDHLHFGLLKASDMILVNYEGVPIGAQCTRLDQMLWLLVIHTAFMDFGGVILTEEEGEHIGAALGLKGKGMILQNHGLLPVNSTVDEACFLMTLVERACQCQLLAEAAAANGLAKAFIPEESARYTFENSSDPETLYWEGQPDLQYEEHMSNGEHRG